MEKMLKRNSKIFYAVILFGFFLLFLYISRYAPVAGDDWGYAVGGREMNPFVRAWGNYFSWSGRFLSELWGFAITPHKKLWNVMNAGIFTLIAHLLWKLSNSVKRQDVLQILLIVFLILSVSDGLRMQTYTWMMGTTYVLPLLFFLIYVYVVKEWIFRSTDTTISKVVCVVCNIVVPLFMENAAAMLFGANCLLLLYVWYKDKTKVKRVLLYLMISLLGVLIIRLSPGAQFRLGRDHASFNALSFFEKVSYNWVAFIRFTFVEHMWLIRVMSVLGIIVGIYQYRQKKITITQCVILLLGFGFGLFQSFAWLLFDILPINLFYILADLSVPHSLTINTIGYTMFTICLFLSCFWLMKDDEKKWTMVWLLFCAGGANIVMLISPIFDIRSSIYTVFLFILYCAFLADTINVHGLYYNLPCVLLVILLGIQVMHYISLYQTVHYVDMKRQSQIQYYHERPDTEEAYILGYPAMSVHSADVLEGDEYHAKTFKEYYYLNDAIQLRFYYLDTYSKEEIFK